MVKRQHQRASSSPSAQIRKPAVTTRSRRSQNTELVGANSIEHQKKFAFDIKRKRKSDIEAVTSEENDGIDRQLSSSYSNNTLSIQNSNVLDSIKLEDSKSVSSPSKRAKLSTEVEQNNSQFDIDDEDNIQDVIQTNVESRGIKSEKHSAQNGVEIHRPLRNGVESRNTDQFTIKNGIENEITEDVKNENKNNKQEIIRSNCKIIQDNIYNNIEKIIDNFKDVIEIRGTQMLIGNFVIEYSDYQKFLTLLNKLMDILETNDSEKLLQNAKKIGYKGNTGQVLNSKLFRAKISKRAYKCLNDFQDDFTCTCNDAIAANPEKRDIGMHFINFGNRLFEQAYKELPSDIKQLCEYDENFDAKKVTKRLQKFALIQPTLDGQVFSSGAIKQLQENEVFQLVGDLQDMAVVSAQSIDKQKIPTIGSVLPKKEYHEPVSEERNVPGVKFHNYKAYASFAPIYDSSAAMLSYEDTILTRAYKKHSHVSKSIDDPDLSEEEENSPDARMDVSESLDKQSNSGNDILIENDNINEKLFEDIDVDLLYKSVKSAQSNEENEIDQILDENVELFKKVQSMQEKRLVKSDPNLISAKERELAIKLQNKLANIISKMRPSDLVSFDSIENAMDNLPIKEKSFKGILPPDKSFAHPTNEVSRDAFGSFSGVKKPSEDTEQAYSTEYARSDTNVSMAQMKSEETLPKLSHQGSSSITPHPLPHPISQQSQSLHHPNPNSLPLSSVPASMTYSQSSRATASQVPMRMSYGVSQGMGGMGTQMTYSRSLSAPSQAPPYYPSRYPSYGYSSYYQQYGYPVGNSAWQQRPSYY